VSSELDVVDACAGQQSAGCAFAARLQGVHSWRRRRGASLGDALARRRHCSAACGEVAWRRTAKPGSSRGANSGISTGASLCVGVHRQHRLSCFARTALARRGRIGMVTAMAFSARIWAEGALQHAYLCGVRATILFVLLIRASAFLPPAKTSFWASRLCRLHAVRGLRDGTVPAATNVCAALRGAHHGAGRACLWRKKGAASSLAWLRGSLLATCHFATAALCDGGGRAAAYAVLAINWFARFAAAGWASRIACRLSSAFWRRKTTGAWWRWATLWKAYA